MTQEERLNKALSIMHNALVKIADNLDFPRSIAADALEQVEALFSMKPSGVTAMSSEPLLKIDPGAFNGA